MSFLNIVSHPMAQTALSRLRSIGTRPPDFRRHLREASAVIFIEATRRLETRDVEVTTPLARTSGVSLPRPIVLAPVLRAALGMLDGIWHIAPEAQIAHLGIYRDEVTLRPQPYYSKFPDSLEEADVFALDPMLATGQSAIEAVNQLKAHGARRLTFLSLIGSPAGLEAFHSAHPEVPVFIAAVDRGLNEQSYIVPGLGDAGDRYFGT
ncbi:MAG: uracil phosphoribosyltransferase [Verrucomicrobiales bacterium]